MTVRILNRAYRDLSEIWNYIAPHNRGAADALEDQLIDAMKQLGMEPGMGHVRDDVRDPRYRFWRVGAYQIACRTEGAQLIICRVVHSSRDFRRLF